MSDIAVQYKNIKSALKRARHFGADHDGPYSVIATTGPAIAARNYAMLLDADPAHDVSEIVVLNMWASAINLYCDANRVADDEPARWAFGSFASRVWFNPEKLQ